MYTHQFAEVSQMTRIVWCSFCAGPFFRYATSATTLQCSASLCLWCALKSNKHFNNYIEQRHWFVLNGSDNNKSTLTLTQPHTKRNGEKKSLEATRGVNHCFFHYYDGCLPKAKFTWLLLFPVYFSPTAPLSLSLAPTLLCRLLVDWQNDWQIQWILQIIPSFHPSHITIRIECKWMGKYILCQCLLD